MITGPHVKEKLEKSKQQCGYEVKRPSWLLTLSIYVVYEGKQSSKAVAVGDYRVCLESLPQSRHPRPADRPQSALLFPLQMSAEDKFVAAVEGAELILPNRSTSCRRRRRLRLLLPCWPQTPTTTAKAQGTLLQSCQLSCKIRGVFISANKKGLGQIQQLIEDHSSAGGVSQPCPEVPAQAQSAIRHVTFSYERELGQSPWSQQVLPTVFSPGRENHVTRAGCHIYASNVAQLSTTPQAKKRDGFISGSPYPFPTVYFYLVGCTPSPPAPSTTTTS